MPKHMFQVVCRLSVFLGFGVYQAYFRVLSRVSSILTVKHMIVNYNRELKKIQCSNKCIIMENVKNYGKFKKLFKFLLVWIVFRIFRRFFAHIIQLFSSIKACIFEGFFAHIFIFSDHNIRIYQEFSTENCAIFSQLSSKCNFFRYNLSIQ